MPSLPDLETSSHVRSRLKAKCAEIVAANAKTIGLAEDERDDALVEVEYAEQMLVLLRDIDRLIGALLTIDLSSEDRS